MSETAVAFGPDRSLVGIWSQPDDPDQRSAGAAVVMVNSGVIHHAGIGRLHVRMARALAGAGVSSLRFDLSGIGDSDRARTTDTLENLVEQDVKFAVDQACRRGGVERIVMMGLCSGARDSLDAAERDPRVAGIIAIDLIADLRVWQHHLVHYASRLFRAESWKNTLLGSNGTLRQIASRVLVRTAPDDDGDGDGVALPTPGIRNPLSRDRLSTRLTQLLGRGTRMLFVFSNGLEYNYNHRSQFRRALPDIASHPAVRVAFFPRADHTFSVAEQRAALIAMSVEWVSEHFPATTPALVATGEPSSPS